MCCAAYVGPRAACAAQCNSIALENLWEKLTEMKSFDYQSE